MSAKLEPGNRKCRPQPRNQNIQGHARDNLIAIMGDTGIGVNKRKEDRNHQPGTKPDPGRSAGSGCSGSSKGGGQHLTFKPDIDHARSLCHHPGEGS